MRKQEELTAEQMAERIATPGQEVIALREDAYVVQGDNIKVCIYSDLGNLVVCWGDVTDNADYDDVMSSMREVAQFNNTGI